MCSEDFWNFAHLLRFLTTEDRRRKKKRRKDKRRKDKIGKGKRGKEKERTKEMKRRG